MIKKNFFSQTDGIEANIIITTTSTSTQEYHYSYGAEGSLTGNEMVNSGAGFEMESLGARLEIGGGSPKGRTMEYVASIEKWLEEQLIQLMLMLLKEGHL